MSNLHLSCVLILVLIQVGSGDRKLSVGGPSIACRPRDSCDECVESQPHCAWCKQQNFTKTGEPDSTRCDSQTSLRQRGCEEGQLVNPKSSHRVTENRPLGQGAGGEGTVQLAPQKISLTLRPGLEESFTVRFQRAEGYPVDLYYLMDLSYSMKDDLENIKKLGHDLLFALKNVTKSVKIGFGSFVDKTVLPYVSMLPQKRRNPCPDRTEQCQPPFSFRHVLGLTEDGAEFEERVSQQNISGNLDTPEGGLDAVMQAAVCGREVGWRNVTRLLVYTSDAAFHTAGDGKLGSVFLPNDGRCHLDQHGLYSESENYDYPSIGQLVQTLSEHYIQPIFAVTEATLSTYQELSKLIPKSVVGELKEDSSNILQLITEAYNNLSSTINLEHSKLPDGVSVRYQSHCGKRSMVHGGRGECSNVHINEEISFTVTVSVSRCLRSEERFEMRILGFVEKLEVWVETVCGCECNDNGSESGKQHCSHGNGTLDCGQCSCLPGRLGKFCECAQSEVGALGLTESCQRDNESSVCGGRGQCLCGRCVCSEHLRGEFCDCDDTNCVRHNNKLCSGNGQCSCGECECNSDYTGDACECSTSQDGCPVTEGSACGPHGDCRCNQCECQPGYQGVACDRCPTCQTACQRHSVCAECLGFRTGLQHQECREFCTNVTVELVLKLQGEGLCTVKTNNSQLIEFIVEERASGTHIRVLQRGMLGDRKLIVICSVTAGIVLIGLGVLVMWRGMVELYDRREFTRFEKEKRNARWNEAGNPLFQSATTTVVNPQFQGD